MTAPDESTVAPDNEPGEADEVTETEEVDRVEEIDDVEEVRPRRRANPVALVVGLLYAAIGVGVLADHNWGGVDLGAVAGASAIVAGTAVIILIARR